MPRMILNSVLGGSMALAGTLSMVTGISPLGENANSRALGAQAQSTISETAAPDSDDHGWQ